MNIKGITKGIVILLFIFLPFTTFYEKRSNKTQKKEFVNLGDLVESIEFSFDPDGKFWGESLFKRQYGNIACQAQILTSVQTRVITNFLNLEVYCRNIVLDFKPKIITLPKPNTNLTGAYIQNHNGKLYSKTSGEIFNFANRKWENAAPGLQNLYYLQPYKNEEVKIQFKKNGCKPLDFKIPTYKNFCIDARNESAILVWNENIYINDDGDLNVYELPKNNTLKSSLSPKNKIKGNDWSYFIVPTTNNSILWGGSHGGYDELPSRCANINIFNGQNNFIRPDPCQPGQVKEWYSIIKKGDDYLIGNFPDGAIYRLNNQAVLTRTKYALPQNIDFVDKNYKTTYRESQSLVSSYGFIWVGMYPFGELFIEDYLLETKKPKIIRLFNQPERDSNPTPFFEQYIEKYNYLYEKEKNTELVYSFRSKDSGSTLRSKDLEPTLLGQRIPSITVLDGKVCASTGNLTFVSPSNQILNKLNIENLDEYGKIHCILIPNQTLLSSRNKNTYKVDIHKEGFYVYSDDKLIRTVKFKKLSIL